MSDPIEYLLPAFEAMISKAYSPKNLKKGDWHSLTEDEIIDFIKLEIKELESEISKPIINSFSILDEATDIIAFCAMVKAKQNSQISIADVMKERDAANARVEEFQRALSFICFRHAHILR